MSDRVLKSETVGAAALTKYLCVKTPGALVVGAAATDDLVGIVQDGAAIGATVLVCVQGVTKAVASAAIAKNALLAAAADGKIVTHAGTSTHPIIGRALEAAGADGDIIEILLTNDGSGPAA